MPRLIDADALLETIEDHCTALSCCLTVEQWRGKNDMKQQVIEDIHNAPTIRFAEDINVPNNGWISVKDRMPESQTCVLVTVKTRNGKHVVLIACHVNAREVDSEDYRWQDAEIDWDYDEENDIYWVPECWYEGNFVEENTSWIIDEYADGIVTHWMPLPEPPKEDDADGNY